MIDEITKIDAEKLRFLKDHKSKRLVLIGGNPKGGTHFNKIWSDHLSKEESKICKI